MAGTTKIASSTEDRVLKSPLVVPNRTDTRQEVSTGITTRERLSSRAATRAEFEDYLRTITNRYGRPYEEASISAYVCPAKTLDQWMAANGIEGDYTVADTAMLNKFFREYYRAHWPSALDGEQRAEGNVSRESDAQCQGQHLQRGDAGIAVQGLGVLVRVDADS